VSPSLHTILHLGEAFDMPAATLIGALEAGLPPRLRTGRR
jgi:hypothetical protein